MIFTRNNIKKTPIVTPLDNVKKPVLRALPIRFGYNMFEAVSKFSNCETCNKTN
jgi:hypothetical protein